MDQALDLGAALKPDMVTLTAPDHITSISVSGMQFEVPEDGVVKAPEHIAQLLESHGFTREKVEVAPDPVPRRGRVAVK